MLRKFKDTKENKIDFIKQDEVDSKMLSYHQRIQRLESQQNQKLSRISSQSRRHSQKVESVLQQLKNQHLISQSSFDRYHLPDTITNPHQIELMGKNMKDYAMLRKVQVKLKKMEKLNHFKTMQHQEK
jgi:hypothetical protein